jgi:undecaprenyl diphosphate synthase
MSSLNHLAIIMDGNGRWAKSKNKARFYGHIRGARVAKKIIQVASDKNIKNLTLFAFSSENWHRPEQEVFFLMKLFAHRLEREKSSLMKNNIRFHVIGDLSRVPEAVRNLASSVTEMTSKNTGMNLTFAISYSGRQDIVATTQRIAEKVKMNTLLPSEIDEACFAAHLNSPFTTDPDVIIRTSGENRLSNFFLWQAAYSEIYFVNTPWPDFNEDDLNGVLEKYSKTERRFGRISSQSEVELQ